MTRVFSDFSPLPLLDLKEPDFITMATNKNTEQGSSYFDIDGIYTIASLQELRANKKIIKNMNNVISINNKKKITNNDLFQRKIFCKNFSFIYDKVLYEKKDLESIYLGRTHTELGEITSHLIFKENKKKTMKKRLYKLLCKAYHICKLKFSSYIVEGDNYMEVINMAVYNIYKLIEELKKENIDIFLFNESFGNKYKFENLENLYNFLETFKILKININLYNIIGLDICMNNKKIPSNKNMYLTQLNLVDEENGCDWFISNNIKYYKYNILNSNSLCDYYKDGIFYEINKWIGLSKINLYNPITNQILKNYYGKKELYSNQFLNNILYEDHDIKINHYFHRSKTYQIENYQNLLERLDNFHLKNNYYRSEFRFVLNNCKNKYKKYSDKILSSLLSFFNRYSTEIVSFTNYPYNEYITNLKESIIRYSEIINISQRTFVNSAKKILANHILFEGFLRGGRESEIFRLFKTNFHINKDYNYIYIHRF